MSHKQEILLQRLHHLRQSKLIAIIRAKNPDVAIERGIELSKLGCRALEVTLDTPEIARVLPALVKGVEKHTLVGVGTVFDSKEIEDVAKWGAKFAISPINPSGFITACHKHGLVSIPGASTPNEIWNFHLEGALMIKIFPAGQWTPNLFQSLREVGGFGDLDYMPSGGITPDNYKPWLEAGAAVVGMGTNLTGKDIKYSSDHPEFKKARDEWDKSGRPIVAKMLAEIAKKYPFTEYTAKPSSKSIKSNL